MVLDHTKAVYTAEDEQGFTFRQINDEDAAGELRARRKKRNRWKWFMSVNRSLS